MTHVLHAGTPDDLRLDTAPRSQGTRQDALSPFAAAAQPPRPYALAPHTWLLLGALAALLHAAAIALLSQRPPALPPVPLPMAVTVEFAPQPAPPVAAPAPVEPPPPVEEPPAPVEPPKAIDDSAPPPKPVNKPVKKTLPPPTPKAPARKPAPEQSTPRAAANTAAPAPVPQPTPSPLTPPSANADYLHNPAPAYPDVAISRGWEGTVLLAVQVRADGKPQTIRLQKSSGYPALDAAAQQAVQRWSFVPAKRDGKAESGWVTIPIDFSLTS